MANKSILTIQEKSDASYREVKVNPLASSVFCFNAAKNPTTVLQSAFGGGGGGGGVAAGRYALEFDGQNYVDLGTSLNGVADSDFTWESWVKHGESSEPNANLFTTSMVDGYGWGIVIGRSGGNNIDFIQFGVLDNFFTYTPIVGQWVHLAFTYTAATSTVEFFLNGISQGTASVGSFSSSSGQTAALGGTNQGGWGSFIGTVDEMRISSVVRYSSDFAPPLYHALDAATVAYWKLDESSGTATFDSSGNGHDGTLMGSPIPTRVTGVGERALQFDGSQNYVSVPNSIDFYQSTMTVECWFKTTQTTFAPILANNPIDNGSGFALYVNTDGLHFDNMSTYQGLTTANVSDGNWHHIAGVIRPDGMSLFIDGELVASNNDSQSMASNNYPLEIALHNPPYPGYALNGSIDEVRLSSVARYSTTFAPSKGYVLDSDTIAYWRMNEGEGTTVYDISGNGHHGTLTGSPLPTWIDAPDSYALQFDGNQNYVTVPNNPVFYPPSITIEFWAKLFSTATTTGWVLNNIPAGTGGGYAVLQANGTIYFMMDDGSANGAVNVTTTTPSDELWHHYAMTCDGITLESFIDGASVGTTSASVVTSAGALVIGAAENGITPCGCVLDELRISDTVRYISSFIPVASFPEDNNTVVYWKFDDGSGTTLTDSSGNGHDGTLTGSPTPSWVTGV